MYKFNLPSTHRATEGGIVTVSMTADHLEQSGIPLDIKDGRVAISPPEHHCMIYGVSGKGKSRRIIYPTVLMSARAGHSIVCVDPKDPLTVDIPVLHSIQELLRIQERLKLIYEHFRPGTFGQFDRPVRTSRINRYDPFNVRLY